MNGLEMLETGRKYAPVDRQVEVAFTKSGFSNLIGGELFEGVELLFDPEFGSVYVSCRGYEVAIHLGNTPEWTTGCADGGFDGALSVSCVEEENGWAIDEETLDYVPNNLFHHVLPTIETNE
jgi:hypothetical protein